MRIGVGSGRARRRARVLACGALLAALATGCAQSVQGTAHPEGEGPTASTGSSAEAGPPTDFQEPSGRPTVTVAPDGAEPVVPGTLSTSPPPPSTSVPPAGPALPTTTGDPALPPLAAPPTGADRPRASAEPERRRSSSGSPQRTAPSPQTPAAPSAPGPGGSGAPAAEPALLTADVLDKECLMDASGFAALLGGPVGKPAEAAVIRPDGSTTRSCYAVSRAGSPAPIAAVNVYRVNRGTPAAFVRAAAGGRPLPGVGEAAVLLDTVGGTTLQVATSRYLVTVNVVDGTPPAQRWAAAGRAVAAAVGRA